MQTSHRDTAYHRRGCCAAFATSVCSWSATSIYSFKLPSEVALINEQDDKSPLHHGQLRRPQSHPMSSSPLRNLPRPHQKRRRSSLAQRAHPVIAGRVSTPAAAILVPHLCQLRNSGPSKDRAASLRRPGFRAEVHNKHLALRDLPPPVCHTAGMQSALHRRARLKSAWRDSADDVSYRQRFRRVAECLVHPR